MNYLRIGKLATAQYGDKELNRFLFSTGRISQDQPLTGKIDEEFVAGFVFKVHTGLLTLTPQPVIMAKLSVLIAIGVLRFILQP